MVPERKGVSAQPSAAKWHAWLPTGIAFTGSLVLIARVAFRVRGQLHFALFDDAMVSMQYAKNLVHGHGLVWNAGEHPVEGYSNFLWTLLMALPHLLGVPERLTSLVIMLFGATTTAATVLIVRRIALYADPESKYGADAAAWFTALSYPLIYWSVLGMEVGLLALFIALGSMLVLRIRKEFVYTDLAGLAGVVVLALLTRDDALVPVVVLLSAAVWWAPKDRRRVVAAVLVSSAVATVAGHSLFRLLYYRQLLPNTYYLKVGGVGLAVRLQRGSIAATHAVASQLSAPIALAFGYVASARRAVRGPTLLLLSLVIGQFAYATYVGGDAWEWVSSRYTTVVFPVMFVLAGLGASRVAERHRRTAITAIGLLAGSVILNLVLRLPAARVHLNNAFVLFDSTAQEPVVTRIALIVALAGLLAIVMAEHRSLGRAAAAVLSVVLVSIVATNGEVVWEWAVRRGPLIGLESELTRYGLAIRESTDRKAKVALVLAGVEGYYLDRPLIDMLGKSDPFIARTKPKGPFLPGHNKWDYDYSVGRLRPDVVLGLYRPTAVDLLKLEEWKYDEIANGVYVRVSSTHVNAERLRISLRRFFGNSIHLLPARRGSG